MSRVKTSANPRIVRVLGVRRGRARDRVGWRLQAVLPHLPRQVRDGEVAVACRRQAYRGQPAAATEIFRWVGIRDAETGRYHGFLTHIAADQRSAEDVAAGYRARWTIAWLFKELKRLYQLDVITRASPVIIEALVLTALLTRVVSHRLRHHLRGLVPPERARRLTPLRGAEVLVALAGPLRHRVLAAEGLRDPLEEIVPLMLHEGTDPHGHRQGLLDPWTTLLPNE